MCQLSLEIKLKLNNYGNQKYNFPDNLSNESQNLREYPFDHLTSNSSLDIRKPLFNNKNNKS